MMDGSQKNPAAANLVFIPGYLLLRGGVPIKVGNETIGAIGVGGAPGSNLDEQCAMSAIEKVKCWRRLNIDQLCRFKIDQGLKLAV